VEALALCGRGTIPAGPNVGIVTGSGGFGVLATDVGERLGLKFPQPTVPATDDMRKYMTRARFANPTDLSAQGETPDKTLAKGIEFLAAQPGLDCIMAMQPHSLLHPRLRPLIMDGLIEGAKAVKVPLFVCGMAAEETQRELWERARITTFESPDDLLAAVALIAGPPEGEVAPADKDETLAVRPEAVATSNALIGEAARKVLEGLSGLELVREATLDSESAAAAFAQDVGRPIMLKVQVPGLAHKSEHGFVVGPVEGDAVTAAYRTLVARRDAAGEGAITAEVFEQGVEVALGAFVDPSFGPVVMVGAGGRLIELLEDVSFAPAPVGIEAAHRMIARLKANALLRGYRGAKPADMEALAQAIVTLSKLVTTPGFAHTQIDINPIVVREEGKGAVAVDYVLA
jgi:acyl-CoA synthetase (NDP forming)